jgi:protein-S-isoprenylcysteine O-methyltransferase Ste14
VPSLTAAVQSSISNTSVGEAGSRGEKVIITAFVLFIMVLLGVLPRLLLLVNLILKLSATVMIGSGLLILLNGIMELKDQMSVFLVPGPTHKLVQTGIYAMVRHPIYGGLILFTFGWSILQDRAYQVLLSLALSMVLVSVDFT